MLLNICKYEIDRSCITEEFWCHCKGTQNSVGYTYPHFAFSSGKDLT